MIESINLLRNMTNDLRQELGEMQTSLNDLHEDVVQEERRQEIIRKQKEEEAKRKAAEEENKK